MKSLKRLFGRKSTRKATRRSPFRISRPIGYASHVERLEDRTLLASNILASLESSVNQPNDTTELVLNVGPGSSPTLGFEVKAAPSSVFDPAAIRIFDANTNAVIPLILSENDHDGSTNSLVLATLNPGEYRIEVNGQSSATGGFIVDVFLPGDSDGDGSVSDPEYQRALVASYQHLFGFNHFTTHLLAQQLGLDPGTNYYSEEMDGDGDGDVDNNDLNLMNANRNIPTVQFELIGDQDAPQILAGLQIDSGVSNSDGITNDLTILGNISDESQITQFKVGLNGAALANFVDILPQVSGGASGGAFTLTRSWLETNLNGGATLEGGTHTLSFFAQDEHDNNNINTLFDVTFELDATSPTLTVTPIINQTQDEDFGTLNLGSKSTFFDQNGGTALSFQIDSITSPIVTLDASTVDLILNSLENANGSTDIIIRATDLAGNSVLSNSFNVLVDPLNDAPDAFDDIFVTDENSPLVGGNVFNANPNTADSDVENDPITVIEVNGNPVSVGTEITLPSGALLTLNSDGTFSYNPNGQFESLAAGQTTQDSFSYTIDDGTSSLLTTDTATVTITINGVNDDASIGGDNVGDMTEDESGDSGTLTITDVDNGEDMFVPQTSIVGTHGTFSIDAAGNWTYTRTADLNALNAGDQVTDTFTVASIDGTATEDVTITINGLNDNALIGGDNAGDMTEDESGDSGTLSVTDVDDGEDVFQTQTSTVGTHGTFSIDANGNWSYTRTADLNALNAGDQVTDTFTVTSSDGTATEDVTITINGLNDDALIGGDNAGDMTEDEAGDSGTLTITDLDDGEDVFVPQTSVVGTHGTFSVDAAGNWSYTRTADLNALNAGDQLTDTFTVTSSDGTATEDVTITINGVNDNASIGGDNAGDMTEDEAGDSGTLSVTDVDDGEDVFQTQTSTVGTHGTFSIDANGNWSYTRTADLNELNAGDQVTDTFTVISSDGSATEDVTITINGLNDDASIGGDNVGDMTEDESGDSGTLTVTDLDDGEDVFVPQVSTVGTHGTFSVDAAGNWSYTRTADLNELNAGDQVTDTFTVASSDGTATEDVTITINGLNDDALIGGDNAGDMTEDEAGDSGTLTITDVDDGEDVFVLQVSTVGTHGTFSVDANGNWTYTRTADLNALNAGDQLTDTFTVTSSDGTATEDVTITINGLNDDAVIGGDNAGDMTEDEAGDSGTLSVTDVDDGEDVFQTQTSTVGTHGTFSIDANGNWTYTRTADLNALNAGDQVTDTFTVASSDGTATEDVTITINGLNDDASIGGDNAGDMTEDEAGDSGTLSVTDLDDGEDIFVTQSSTVGTHGTFSVDANGNWTYTRTADLNALNAGDQVTDTFTVTSSDGTATEDVTITINGLNDDAVIGGDNAGDMTEDEAGDSGTLTITDVDDGEANFVTQTSTVGTHGTFSVDANGNWTYTRTADLNALNAGDQLTDTFTVTSSDGSATEDVTITINGLNDNASIGGDNAGDMTEDEAGDSGTLTVTDLDDGEDIFVTQTSTVGTHGTFSVDANGNWSYTRTADLNSMQNGDVLTDTFTVASSDGTATEDVTITINGVNDDPVAVDDAFTTDEDSELTGGNVLDANPTTADSDLESQSFTVTEVNGNAASVGNLITLGSGAKVLLSSDGTFVYDPNGAFDFLAEGADGSDSFTYTITDSQGGMATGTVDITINGLNDDPVAQDDNFDVNKDIVFNGDVFADNGNGADFDVDNGDSFTVSEVIGSDIAVGINFFLSSGAILTLNNDGLFTYDPNDQFDHLTGTETATDTFSYTITDLFGDTSVATVKLTISANQLPIATADDGGTTDEETLLNINIGVGGSSGILGNDTDPDGLDSDITFTGLDGSTSDKGASLNVNGGVIEYDPSGQFDFLAAGEQTTDTFDYTIEDNRGGQATGTVTVTITGVNDNASIGGDNAGDMTEDEAGDSGTLTITDVDNGEDVFVAQTSTVGTHGTFSVDAAGNWSYTRTADLNELNAGDQVTDTFTVTSSDGTATEDVTITINGLNDDALIGGDSVGDMTEDESGDSGTLSVTDVDDGEDIFQTQTSVVGTHGTFSVDAAGNWTYTRTADLNELNAGDQVTDTFTVTSSDGTATEDVTITINGLNDDALIGGDNAGDMTEDEAGDSGTLTITDLDDGEDVFVPQTSVVGTHGTFSVDAAGNWSYTRTADLNALNAGDQVTDTFTVASSDGTATEDVTITINGLNDDALIGGDNAGDMTEDESGDSGTLTITDVDDGEDVFTPQVSTVGTHGTFSVDAAGNWSYTRTADLNALNAGDQVTDTFTVTSSDGSATEDVTITINGLNDNASIGGDNVGDMTEDEAGDSGTLTITDLDDGENIFVTQTSTVGTHGTFSVDANGNWSYTRTADLNALNAGDQVTDTFTVASSDGTASEDVTITINGLNDDALIGGDNAGDMTEDEAGDSGTLTITDVDDGEDVFTPQVSTVGTHGTFSVDAAGNWTYTRTADLNTLNAGDQVTDTFTVTSSDGSATEDVTITINGLNDNASIGGDNAGDMTEDEAGDSGTLTITDVDDGEDVFQTQTSTVGTHGTFSVDAAGNWTYTRTADLNALNAGDQVTDTFTVASSDGSATEDVTITINGLNDTASIGGDNAGDMTEDEAGDSGTLTITDLDDGEDVFVPQTSVVGTHGTFSVDAAGNWSYTRTADLNALNAGDQVTDTFTVASSDGTATEDVTITINGLNDDASIGGDNVGDMTEDESGDSGTLTITDLDDGEDVFQTQTSTVGTHGTFSVDAAGNWSYTRTADLNTLNAGDQVTDTFTVTSSDGSATEDVTITINGLNDTASIGGDNAGDMTEDEAGDSGTLTITDLDDGEDIFVTQSSTAGTHGTFSVDANGNWSYTRTADLNSMQNSEQLTDTFTVTSSDGTATEDVTITINGVNDDPVAVDDVFTTDQDTVLNGASSVFTANPTTADSDPESQSFTVTGVSDGGTIGSEFALGSGALLTINLDGTFSYDPNGAFDFLADGVDGSDSFTYTITDSQGGMATGTVDITINGLNDDPVAQDDAATTSKNNTVNIDVRVDNGSGADTDPDTNDVLTVIQIDGQTATIGNAITLTSGATVTLQLNGTVTYDPNGQFNGLILPTDEAIDTFDYQISDGGSTDTATVTVTVTGSNELLMLTNPIPDISRDGLTPESIDLDNHFNDADAGDDVTYQVLTTTLVGGGVLPSDFWVNNVSISGSDLDITYSNYTSNQVRLPVEITVRAMSSDGLSPDVDETFILTPDPQTTAEIRLIARPTESSGRDFTGFRAESTGTGTGTFMLTNGMQDLNYSIYLGDFDLDMDGTDTPGDSNDDLTAVRIIDTSDGDAVLFTLFHSTQTDDNPTVDLIRDILTGTWDTSDNDALTSTIIDKLYDESLAIQIEQGSGFKTIVSGGNILLSPEVDGDSNLPSESTQYVVGQEYVVEIWISDQLGQVLAGQITETNDITSILFDLLWDDTAASTGIAASVTPGDASAFSITEPPSFSIGEFAGFSGVTFTPDFAEGSYARVGFAKFRADGVTPDLDPVEYSIDVTPDELLLTRGDAIDLSQISLVGTSVTHLATSEFFIQTGASNVSVTGTIDIGGGQILDLDPQGSGLESTSLSGRFTIFVDDFNNPSMIQIIDSTVEINPTGESRPDRGATGNFVDTDLADFGLQGRQMISNVDGNGNDGLLSVAIRDAVANVFSSEQVLSGGLFDIAEDWILTSGQLDSFASLEVPGFGTLVVNGTDSSDSTSGLTMTFFTPTDPPPAGLTSWNEAKLNEVSPGEFELIIPISRRLSFTTAGGQAVVLDYVGSVTSTFSTDGSDRFGDTIGTAENTGLTSAAPGSVVFQGIIGNNDSVTLGDPLLDVDMFQVELGAGDSVTVDVDADMFGLNLDSVVRVFDASGNQVAASDNDLSPDEFQIAGIGEGIDSFVTFTNNTGSTANFFIGLSAYNEALSPAENLDPGVNYNPLVLAGRPSGVEAPEVGSYDITISVQNVAAPPLHGTVTANSGDTLTEGTTIDMVVVRNQTELDSLGRATALPGSDSWIDEWSSFWVEIYVETADAKGITDATVDLNYNTSFFTATAIEFGNQFADTGNAVIDDATGIVTSLSGIAHGERAGSNNKALLARVKFESLEQDDVSIDFEDKFIGPHALGLSLSNVSVSLTDNIATNVIVGDAPETDLWAIAYDVNDDDIINFRDLMVFASIYGQNVLDTNSPYVWALDADKSGTVNFKDLTHFAANYGVSKGGDRDIVYPANFLQRWYGQTTAITGDSSIDEVMDVAMGMWQDALGLEQPLDIQLVITDLGGTQLGEGQITAIDEQGRPVAGIVTLDDDAAGLGWYSDIDTTAFGGGELEGGTAYTADSDSDAAGRYDLLTVLIHEIGHVAGFTETYAPFESHVEAGVGGTLSFVGSGFEATLTEDGLHLDDSVHAGDVMNATLDPGVRKLPSVLDALILQTAHETAANGNFEISFGVNAPLMANLPASLVSDIPQLSEGTDSGKLIQSIPVLEPMIVTVSNNLTESNESSLPTVSLTLNHLNLNSSETDKNELDLTLLEGFSDELINDLRLNGLNIVDAGEAIELGDSNLIETDLNLSGISEQLDAGFDDVFTDWAGPIL